MLGVNLAAGARRRLLDALARAGRLGRRQRRPQPAICDPPDPLEGPGAATAKPNLQWVLERARGRRRHVARGRLRPAPPCTHRRQRLLEQGTAICPP